MKIDEIKAKEIAKAATSIGITIAAAGLSSYIGGWFFTQGMALSVISELAKSQEGSEGINFLKSISGNLFTDFSKSMGNKVSDRIQHEKLQSANHHLQRSFQEAAKYALIDIGGADIFAQEWQTHQHEKNRAAHPVIKQAPFASTESYLKLLRQQPVLAKAILGQIGELFRGLIKLIDADKLLSINVAPPDANQTPAVNDIRKLMNETQPEVFSAAFCEYFVAPAHDAYLNICNLTTLNRRTQEEANESFFAKHLRDHLLSCTLAHFGEILKTDTAPYRAYVRETLNDMRANLHDIKSDSLELQTGQAKIIAKIDGLIAQTETLGDGKTLDLLNNNIADLLGALGKAEKQDAQNFSDLFVFVTQHAAARDAKYDSTFTQILAALQRHLGEQRATSDVYLVEGLPSPYLDLAAYTFNDSAKFGGRDDEVKLVTAFLTDRDRERNLLFIVGASGCGKSSFAQAGLAPALQRHYAALGKTLAYAVMRPGNNPTGNLKNALDALDVANCKINLLVVDQAEELFTQANEADRRLFLQWLAGLEPFAQSQQFVLVTLRREYENEFAARLGAMDIYDLVGMGREHLEQAIIQPISSAYPDHSKQIEPALVSKLALEAADRPTLLPLLQATLTELWKKGRLTLANYGRLIDAIDKLADTVYQFEEPSPKALKPVRSPENQRALLGVFTDLVKVSLDDDSAHDVRRSLPREAFGSERADLITELVNKRLLAVDNNQISIIHEALIEHWKLLHVTLNQKENRKYFQQRGRFELNLAQWQAHEKPLDRYLLTDEELNEARELEMRDDIVLRAFPAAREFLRVSRNAIEDKRQRAAAEAKKNAEVLAAANAKLQASQSRLRRAFAGVLALALMASDLGGWAYVERNNAVNAEERAIKERDNAANAEALAIKERNNAIEAQKIAQSRELAALAQTQLDVNVETSVLIAIEANQIAHTNESRMILQQGLEKSVKSKRLNGHTKPVNSAAWSPDGKQVLTTSDDNARIWEASSGKTLSVLSGHTERVRNAAWSPDGKQVLTESLDKTTRIWAASSGKMLSVLSGHTGSVYSAAWSPDGKQVLTASDDTTARIWEASSGKTLNVLRAHAKSVNSAVWSPDGKQVLTASSDNTARIWEASSGKTLSVLSGHTDWVRSAAWSQDGKQVLTASGDKTARIWDANSGKTLSVLSGHTDSISSATWSPDGKQVLTASNDNTARLYLVNIEDLMAVAKTYVSRELDCEERVKFLNSAKVCVNQ